MTSQDIVNQRLSNQQIVAGRFTRPHQLVGWMGCIQAEDFSAAKWAIGARIRGLTEAAVGQDFDEGRILRTHLLRPEWQLVTPEDIGWMLTLTAPGLRLLSRDLLHRLGIGEKLSRLSKKGMASALAGGRQLTRLGLSESLKEQDLDLDDVRVGVLLMDAELDGLICSGPRRGGQFTYMLLEDRAPALPQIDKDTALARLAQRYFSSHGPATLEDLKWWSGLRHADVKRSMEMIGPELSSLRVNGRQYWFAEEHAGSFDGGVSLLPAFDEYTLAYQDKADILPAAYPRTGQNDIFGPVIIAKGRVAGTWKAGRNAGGVRIETMPAWTSEELDPEALQAAAADYARFLGKELRS